jgi:RNase P subunit RPR2
MSGQMMGSSDTRLSLNRVREWCDGCGEETIHAVDLEMRSEGSGESGRGPCRTTECQSCGREESNFAKSLNVTD